MIKFHTSIDAVCETWKKTEYLFHHKMLQWLGRSDGRNSTKFF